MVAWLTQLVTFLLRDHIDLGSITALALKELNTYVTFFTAKADLAFHP